MSIFKKKTSEEDIPEIPAPPKLPSFNVETKPPANLPHTEGDARDSNNQEVIKSALDSSEKISGDSGAASSPSEVSSIPIRELPIPPVSSPPVMAIPPVPIQPKRLPDVPRYQPKQEMVMSSALPIPPIKETPMVNLFIQPEEEKSVELPKEERTVRKDASESIFVRIDKFNSAKRDVEEIGRDLKQITQVIEKISDVKLKEDEEITEISKTLEEIKNRINRIESEVFNRL